MLLACLLFALLTVGLVIPCVIDIASTPYWEFRTLTKRTWLVLAIACWVPGAAAWLIVGRRRLRRRIPLLPRSVTGGWVGRGFGQAEAFRRHPAGRAADPGYLGPTGWQGSYADVQPARPAGPDDDPEFLLELERRIREARGDR